MTTLVAPTSKLSRALIGGFNPMTISSKSEAWISGRGYVTPAGTLTGWYDQVQGATHGMGAPSGGALTGTLGFTSGPNNTPAITFNGTSNVGQHFVGTVAQPCHLFVVGKFDADGSAGTLIDGVNGNTGRLRRTASTTLKYNAGGSEITCAGCTPLTFHLHELFLSGAASFYKQDGTTLGSGDGGTATMGRTVIAAFGTTIADFAPVTIAEVWRFNAQVTGANLTGFKAYITAKFGLTLS